jgi:hypothetical protein
MVYREVALNNNDQAKLISLLNKSRAPVINGAVKPNPTTYERRLIV